MKATPFALALVAVLAACSSTPQTATPKIATIEHKLRPGTGTVQNVMPAPQASATASAGASQPMQRLEIRMQNGGVQYVDVPGSQISKGDRVEISADGVIRRG